MAKTLSAGVAVLRPAADGWRCLLLRCYRNWDFPKGLVEPGEDPLDAARREVTEETTLQRLEFRWGEGYRETAPYRGGKVARYYIALSPSGEVDLPVSPELGHPEHHEYRWASFAAAERLLSPRVQPVLAWVRQTVESAA